MNKDARIVGFLEDLENTLRYNQLLDSDSHSDNSFARRLRKLIRDPAVYDISGFGLRHYGVSTNDSLNEEQIRGVLRRNRLGTLFGFGKIKEISPDREFKGALRVYLPQKVFFQDGILDNISSERDYCLTFFPESARFGILDLLR